LIDVARNDHWAASGSGPLHRSSTISKVIFRLLVVSATVITRNPLPLMLAYGALLAMAAFTGLPWIKITILSWYGAVFVLLYAISFKGGVLMMYLFIVKAITPAFPMLMIIVSTPYPKIFFLLSVFLLEVRAASLYMIYRMLFILLDMMGNFVNAIRIRDRFSPGSLYKKHGNISKDIGMLLIKSVERASSLYAIIVVRGYNGSMAEESTVFKNKPDWLPSALVHSCLCSR